jgi:preflagellin peptidase FlaK
VSDLDLVRLVAGAAFLGAAAVSDWRTRIVKDRLWIAMGTLGLALFAMDLWFRRVDPVVGLVLVPTAVLMYDPLIGQEFRTDEGWKFPPSSIAAYALAIGATAYAIWDLQGDAAGWGTFLGYLTVPVMMLLFRAMYEVHILKGGADAKAMIVIAAFVPLYPNLPPFPLLTLNRTLQAALGVLFPFSLLVLLNAALLFAAAPLAFLAYNATRGDVEFPMAFLGYKVSLRHVPRFVWFMDEIVDGEHVLVYFPKKRQDRVAIMKALRAAGLKEAWVTPQLPFMIPLSIGYVLAFIVGNPLMALFQAFLPAR